LILHAGFVLHRTLQGTPIQASYRDTLSAQIAQLVRAEGTTLVIGSMDLANPSPPLLDWHLITEAQLLDVPLAGSLAQIEVERRLLSLARRLPLPPQLADQFEQVLTRSDTLGETRSLYIGLPSRASYSQSQEGLHTFLNDLLAAPHFESVIVITTTRAHANYPLAYIAPSLEDAGLRHTANHTLDNCRIQVDVYR
jgi:hypothetical protein